MNSVWSKIIYWFGGDRLGGVPRSSSWGSFKKNYEKTHPKECAICGNKKVSLHHIIPFSQDKSRELDVDNVIWLCDGWGTLQHHRGMGHYGSFLSWNPDIISEAKLMKFKFENRL